MSLMRDIISLKEGECMNSDQLNLLMIEQDFDKILINMQNSLAQTEYM